MYYDFSVYGFWIVSVHSGTYTYCLKAITNNAISGFKMIIGAPKCPDGKEHKESGTMCGQECGSFSRIIGVDLCDNEPHTDGCFCPNGTFWNDEFCVPPNQCPCKKGDAYYPQNAFYELECEIL